jgi:hypothetical protein
MDEVTVLKAKAFDLIAQIETFRMELSKVNQQISDIMAKQQLENKEA